MVELKIDAKVGGVEELEKFSNLFTAFAAYCKQANRSEARQFALQIQEKIRSYAPAPEKGSVIATGKLQRSVRIHELARREGVYRFRVYVSAVSHRGYRYFYPQEFGTKRRRSRKTKMEWRLPSGKVVELPYGLMVFRSSLTGEYVAKREVKGVGESEIGKKTVHFFTRGWTEGLKEIDEYIKWSVSPTEELLEKYWRRR